MPSGMTVREFDRRADRLVAILPHAAALAAAGRLRDGSDHAGPEAHPYDASVLHVWELYRMERDGLPARIPGLPDAFVSADGIANLIVDAVSDLSDAASAARVAGWPLLRVWMRGETDPLPYRFLLVRP